MDVMWWKMILLVLLMCFMIDSVSGSCKVKSFGTTCQYNQFQCRCRSGSTCNDVTGECNSGCDPEWMGPACQYGNLAYGRSTVGTFTQEAFITDGDKSTCASGRSLSVASVDLGSKFVVERLLLYNKDYVTHPLQNFRIYVGMEKNDVQTNSLCYTHTTNQATEVSYIKCQQLLTGRYIHVQLPDTSREMHLCEIEIFGGLNGAYKQVTDQSTTNPLTWYSSNAVDGDLGNTAHTEEEYKPKPWWYVRLSRTLDIQWIRVYNRQDCCQSRLNNFVLILHDGGKTEEQHTFENLQDDTQTSKLIDIPVVPIKAADKVELRYEGSGLGRLNINEVEVYFSCPNGRCGIDCVTCKCFNVTEICDKIYGTCSSGCQSGYIGNDCQTVCPDGTYGLNCLQKCATNCKQDICNNVNGVCTQGCKPGYKGEFCHEVCPAGTYGLDCLQKCSTTCKQDICNNVNGVCTQGCEPGYKGELCDEVCPDGTYGLNCLQKCATNCKQDICNNVNGSCIKGCKPGYKGELCDEVCSPGTYGINCLEICDTCNQDACNNVNGSCTQGCKPGYKGELCDEVCPPGTYGMNCLEKCNTCNQDTCNNVNGSCTQGCKAGYKGELCDEECNNGTFGNNCAHNCNCEKTDEVCTKSNGYCVSGCRTGYEGEGCRQECRSMTHGRNCSNHCGKCAREICDNVDGSCKHGCIAGYNGSLCVDECATGTYGMNCSNTCDTCNDGMCDHVVGSCRQGCIDGYEGELCKEAIKDSPNTGAIVGGVVSVLVALLVVGVIVFVLRRKRKKNKEVLEKNSKENCYENAAELETTLGSSSRTGPPGKLKKVPTNQKTDATVYEPTEEDEDEIPTNIQTAPDLTDGTLYINVEDSEKTTRIEVDDLWNYVSKMNQNAFKAEFEQFPGGMVKPYEVAKANMVKNRYRGIYAYDHTRVKLSPPNDDGCDYMNANFVGGYGRSRKFIASQGATEHNIADFWLMIWQQKCRVIVMLTNINEEGRVKCLKYWPDEGAKVSFGSVEVEFVEEEVFCNFTVRTLEAKKDGESRYIYQCHFTTWPDKGVPAYPSSLVQFHKKITPRIKKSNYPVVVHCSAGIGRTGTFISLDYLIDEANDSGVVDVFECVQKLREQRTNMIQTLDQYIFLHTALVEALHCKGHSMPMDEFRNLYRNINSAEGMAVLEDDFKKLKTVYAAFEVKFTEGKKPENVSKNRKQNILPADSERPILALRVPGCNDYINAVFLPGLRKRRQFVVTQTPLENTVIDFWRMVYTLESCVIVDLSSDPESYQVFPDKNDLRIGPFTVTTTKQEYSSEIESTVHQLSLRCDEQQSPVLYKPQFWDLNKETPSSVPLMIKLFYEVNKAGQYGQNGGIVVVCPDGASRCGLFCTAFVSLDRLRVEQEIGTGQIIKQYRSIRPQIIPNKEQLKYCYDILMHHIDENDTYSNFS